MSDFPNGRPPGQNNIDAGSPAYVPPENDPSATAQKPDEDRPKEDGIEVRESNDDPKVQQELAEASKNVVQPSNADDEQPREPAHRATAASGDNKSTPEADPNESKQTKPGAAANRK